MPVGEKTAYSDKQKRMASHIEESEKERGASDKKAARIAWATVNKTYGGGKKGTKPERETKAKKSTATKSSPTKAKTAPKSRKPATRSSTTARTRSATKKAEESKNRLFGDYETASPTKKSTKITTRSRSTPKKVTQSAASSSRKRKSTSGAVQKTKKAKH